jgi:hypothetical protein
LQYHQEGNPLFFRGGGGGKYAVLARHYKSTSNNTTTTTSAEACKEEEEDDKVTKPFPKPRQTPSSSPSSEPERFLRRCSKLVRKTIAGTFSAVGFVSSALIGADPWKIHSRTKEPLLAFQKYMKKSGIDQELIEALLNRNFGRNLWLLSRIQQEQQEQDTTKKAAAAEAASKHKKRTSFPLSAWQEEAQRYMRYATAVYGQAMIHAAQVDAKGVLDRKWGQVTLDAIARHVGIPVADVVLINLHDDNYKNINNKNNNDASNDDDDDDDDKQQLHNLKHFVAVDHAHKAVVLSIRGTFSIEEIVIDVTAYSREFCGGEGHSEMATMAERVWDVAGPTVESLLTKHEGYELIVTGHSLGAGTACLLNILVHTKKLLPRAQLKRTRCFAFASPPVYTPMEFVPRQCLAGTTNFIHQDDAVPFLSIHSVRRLLAQLACVQDECQNNKMTRRQRAKILLGLEAPPKELADAILIDAPKKVAPKQGAPQLCIPAGQTIWLLETSDGEGYTYETFRPKDLVSSSSRGGRGGLLQIRPNMLVDHFPPRYEHALDHLLEERAAVEEDP